MGFQVPCTDPPSSEAGSLTALSEVIFGDPAGSALSNSGTWAARTLFPRMGAAPQASLLPALSPLALYSVDRSQYCSSVRCFS